SASSSSNARATPTGSYPACKPSASSSTSWASASAASSRAAPKKSEGNRCHICQFSGGPSPRRRRGGHLAAVAGRQGPRPHSPRPDRPLLARRQEPHRPQGGRPRLQAWGEADPLRHLPARPEGAELLLHLLEGDQRLHGGSAGRVVAGEPVAPPQGAQAVAGPG